MRGGYGEYDQSLRDLAERLRKHTKLDVVLDDKSPLFAAGKCPDAALYCGWYSLANYVDAFAWRPGAVGYHIASSEAVDLRQPGSLLWCPAMLERGVVATLGPTFEPYLSAFPLPDDFFPLAADRALYVGGDVLAHLPVYVVGDGVGVRSAVQPVQESPGHRQEGSPGADAKGEWKRVRHRQKC